jgi:enoyl-CoA hydratase
VVASRRDLTGLIVSSKKDGIFIAGADLKELYGLVGDETGLTRRLLQAGLDVLAALEAMPFPTVAMIDGAALGGGLEVALACDFRVAGSHPKCKLGLPEVKLGLIPGWGGTQRLPRLVGLPAGAEMLITGRSYTPLEAFAIGLIDDSVPSDQLEAAAVTALSRTDWSARRSKRSNLAIGDMPTDWSVQLDALSEDERPAADSALRVVAEGAKLPLSQATAIETDAFVPLLNGPAARRRIEAFLKK